MPSQIKAGDWFEKYSFKKTKIPQDLWHQDIVLLCQYELIAQTNRQCNFVFYHSKLIDPLFDTGNLHGATDQFCEAASYPPERLLGARIDHFRSVPLGKFLETDDFPLLTRTHVEDCVHAAKPGGLLRILGRRLEIPLGKDLAYVSSVPRNPHNWAFIKSEDLPYRLITERRDYNHIHVVVISPPGHSAARARWRRLVRFPSSLDNPFEQGSRLTALSFLIPYEAGTFPSADHKSDASPDARLEAEATAFDDVILVQGSMPSAGSIDEAMKGGVGHSEDNALHGIRLLGSWMSNAMAAITSRMECSYVVVVIDDNMLLSLGGLWGLIDNTLYKSMRHDWIMFEGVFHARFSAGYSGHGLYVLSRDMIAKLGRNIPKYDHDRPGYWQVDTSFGTFEDSNIREISGNKGLGDPMLHVVFARVHGVVVKAPLPSLPSAVRLERAQCSGNPDELSMWREVLAIGPRHYNDDADAQIAMVSDRSPLSFRSLGWQVTAAWDAAWGKKGITGPCLQLVGVVV